MPQPFEMKEYAVDELDASFAEAAAAEGVCIPFSFCACFRPVICGTSCVAADTSHSQLIVVLVCFGSFCV